MGHTPLPWSVKQVFNSYNIADSDDMKVGNIFDEPNAKFIVRACNAHDDLLEACRMAREELVFGGDWATASAKIEAAIAKATE